MRLYAEALDCERCILYCREPDLRRANTTHAWWSEEPYAVTWESWFSSEWVDEGPPNAEDPLFAAALQSPAAIYIGDIENDPTGLVNLEFEQRIFLHQALIHAPVYYQGKCYGILEPSVLGMRANGPGTGRSPSKRGGNLGRSLPSTWDPRAEGSACVNAGPDSRHDLDRRARLATYSVPGYVDFLAPDGRGVWATNTDRVERLKLGRLDPVATVVVPGACGAMAVAAGSLWVASCYEPVDQPGRPAVEDRGCLDRHGTGRRGRRSRASRLAPIRSGFSARPRAS